MSTAGLVCTHCGCSEIDTDPARGDAVCTGCGSVLEDQIIVSEVQFQVNSGGGSDVIGQYVAAEGGKSINVMGNYRHGMGKESREITLQNGKNRLQKLGSQLKLNQHCIDTGYNFFKMALGRGLTKGRRTTHVTAACLYMVCRTEGTPHMLLDFSDVLQVDVYYLGRTYLQLSKELCINIPALDPCLYIPRFAHSMELGDKTHEVSMTAMRLVSRMKRDWMAQGRRPSGLCGAALIVAARIHNFNRTIKDVVRIVKIGGNTIRKRLAEFEQTPSSKLTIDEFQKIDLEEEMDPPCYTEGKKKAKLAQLEPDLVQITEEINKLQEEIDKEIQEMNHKRFRRYSKLMSPQQDQDSCSEVSRPPTPSDLDKELEKYSQFIDSKTLHELIGKTHSEIAKEAKDDDDVVTIEVKGQEDDGNKEGGERDPVVESLEQHELDNILMPPPISDALSGPRPTVASLGITTSIQECVAEKEEGDKDSSADSGVLDLTGIDDDELEHFILNEDEVKIKTTIWMRANAEFLREQKALAEKRAKEEEEKKNKPESKRKKRVRKKIVRTEASSAGEAIEKMLQEKKISSKINYDVLKDLNQPQSEATKSETLQETQVIVDTSPLVTKSRFKRVSSTNDSVKTEKPSPRKKAKVSVKEEPAKSEEPSPSKPAEVIVECGPVDYAAEDEAEEHGEQEEEEEHYSAARLFGNSVEDDYGYDDYDD